MTSEQHQTLMWKEEKEICEDLEKRMELECMRIRLLI